MAPYTLLSLALNFLSDVELIVKVHNSLLYVNTMSYNPHFVI